MSRRTQENLMALAFLLVFIGFLVVALGYGQKTRLVPVPLAVVSILLILLQLVLQNLRSNLQLSVDTMELFAKKGDGGCDESKEGDKRTGSRGRKEAVGMGLVALFVAMILLLGMFPAVFLYIFGYFALIGRQGWLKALALSGTATIVSYLLFSSLLGVSPYEGWLGSLM